MWRTAFETLERARLAGHVDDYHRRPHSGLNDQTPAEVAATWEDGQTRLTHASRSVNTAGELISGRTGASGAKLAYST